MPPLLPPASAEYYSEQRGITAQVLATAHKVWGTQPPAEFDTWFAANGERLAAAVTLGQRKAVEGADNYVGTVLDQLGTPVDPDVGIDTSRLIGVASDGRDLEGLLYGAVINAKHHVGQGMSPATAWEQAAKTLLVYTQTQVADASRAAVGLGITARHSAGYVRMLNPPSCSRCAILAGRWYRKPSFLRHPGCDCRHIPAVEHLSGHLTTDPKAYFDSLAVGEQNKLFTAAGAAAIREGADPAQVVNARRGMQLAGVYGHDLLITTEGVTKRGLAGQAIRARGRNPRTTPRLMPEAIYEIAESRTETISLLRKNGFILDDRPAAAPLTPQLEIPAAAPVRAGASVSAAKVAEAAATRKRSPFAGQSSDELAGRLAAKADAGEIDDEFDALAAEIDRRDLRAQAMRERRATGREAKARAQDDAYERLLGEGLDDEDAIEQAYGVPVDQQRRRNARSTLAGWGYDAKNLDQQVRAWHRDEAHRAWLDAEDSTNGYMLSRAGERAGADPRSLWSIPEDRARKYASEELRAWWDEHGRITVAELKAQLLDPTELARIQSRRRDFLT